MTILTITEQGAPDRVTAFEFASGADARDYLAVKFGNNIREYDEFSGVIGTMTGRVFQASKFYRIS